MRILTLRRTNGSLPKNLWLASFLLYGGLLIAALVMTCAQAQAPHVFPNVLILNSYHPGDEWSDQELAGIMTTLQQSHASWIPAVEYLDTKRFSNPDYLLFLKNFLQQKYQGHPIDLLLILDNSALNLMLQYRSELFPGIPIVFAGINGFRPDLLQGQNKITGVVEVQDMAGTLQLALSLHPKTRQILVIRDYTASGLAVQQDMEMALANASETVKAITITFSPDRPFSDLEQQLKALPADALVLIPSYTRDSTGRVFSRAESTLLITAASPVPVYAMHESRLGYGIVGGMLLDGKEHGAQAAEIALRVLAGEDPSRIPIATSHSYPIFDDVQLRRFHISPAALPAHSTIINQPTSLYTQHQGLVLTIVTALALLVLVVTVLSVALKRARQAKAALHESENRYRIVADYTYDWEYWLAPDGSLRYISPSCERISGYRASEFLENPELLDTILHPEDCEYYDRHKHSECWVDGGPVHELDFRIIRRDGSVCWIAHTCQFIHTPDGKNIGKRVSNRDITERKQIERTLQDSEERFRVAMESIRDAFIIIERENSTILWWNSAAETIFGYRRNEIIGKPLHDWLAPARFREAAQCGMAHFSRSGEGPLIGQVPEIIALRKNGEEFPIELSLSAMQLGGQWYAVGVARDISERKQAETALRENEERYRALFENSRDAIFVTDAHTGCIRDINKAAEKLLMRPRTELIGLHQTALHPPGEEEKYQTTFRQHLSGDAAYAVAEIYTGDRRRIPVEISASLIQMPDGSFALQGFFRDVTERRAAEESIHRLAYYDPLTELPNRRQFLDHLSSVQAIARRDDYHGAVLLVDLDNFKRINDACGHDVGDRLLKEVATRLLNSLREEDTVARFGGDEFAIVLPSIADSAIVAARLAHKVAEKIRSTLAIPFSLQNREYLLGASIGVTLFPKGGETAIDLIKQADTALYRAKEAGRNTVSFFESAMQATVETRFMLEGELRRALEKHELRLYFQPQVNREGRIIGAEALLRWQHHDKGLVSPIAFIPLAEETGLIIPMGEWVLAETCHALTRLDAAGHSLRLAVNVSPRQFRQSDFVERVMMVIAATGANPDQLTLEVTEGLVIEDIQGTVAKMVELKTLGIHLSIDDFGTGYSSLAYLKRLPLDELKIDKSFVQDVLTDPNDAALIEVILAVAHHLNLAVVAEGVEQVGQAIFLKDRGCAFYQGYFYGRPEPAEAFLQKILQTA